MRMSATSPTITGAARLARANASPTSALAARSAAASGESPLVMARGPSASRSRRNAGAGSPEAERRGALSNDVASRSGVMRGIEQRRRLAERRDLVPPPGLLQLGEGG